MTLDLDLEKLLEDFLPAKQVKNSELAHLLYKYLPHNDHVDALEEFSKVSIAIENDFNSERTILNITNQTEQEKLLFSTIEKFGKDEGWFLIYAENLNEEIEIIVNEYFKNGK